MNTGGGDEGCAVQVCCYEDSKLLKLFTDIVRMLYDCDILAEDTINWWAKKASSDSLQCSRVVEWSALIAPEILLVAHCPAFRFA